MQLIIIFASTVIHSKTKTRTNKPNKTKTNETKRRNLRSQSNARKEEKNPDVPMKE